MNPDRVIFVVVCAPRTGSNLLVSLLNSHPDVMIGGEVFNQRSIEEDKILWPDPEVKTDPHLLELRRSDPVAFLERLLTMAGERHSPAALGFKYLYWDAHQHAAVTEHLREQQHIKILHLKRRNRLERMLSAARSRASGVWVASTKSTKPSRQPAIELAFEKCQRDFERTENDEVKADAMFASHDVFQLTYEDLVADTRTKCDEIERWLGVRKAKLASEHKKLRTTTLRESIANYDELKERFADTKWAHHFSE